MVMELLGEVMGVVKVSTGAVEGVEGGIVGVVGVVKGESNGLKKPYLKLFGILFFKENKPFAIYTKTRLRETVPVGAG